MRGLGLSAGFLLRPSSSWFSVPPTACPSDEPEAASVGRDGRPAPQLSLRVCALEGMPGIVSSEEGAQVPCHPGPGPGPDPGWRGSSLISSVAAWVIRDSRSLPFRSFKAKSCGGIPGD